MINNNYAVIMAGGIGSRFWPVSTSNMPKQFLDILGTGETLLQQTYRRLLDICPDSQILIVTNKRYKDICINQLPNIVEENILCEPNRRNTAPCIAYASFKIYNKNKRANIIVSPSDHIITNESEFNRIVRSCLDLCINIQGLFTLGIKPSRPETGYGYIQYNEETMSFHPEIKKVKTFTEKPDSELANKFLDSGDFLWNSGMFLWSVESILNEFKSLLPDIYDLFLKGDEFYNTDSESSYIDKIYSSCKNISIDYGIMEKSNSVFVYPSDFGWSDIGTWVSLSSHINPDENDNILISDKTLLYNSSNNIVKISADKMCLIQGLEGYIVIDTEKALLICKKEEEQKIKNFMPDVKLNIGDDFT